MHIREVLHYGCALNPVWVNASLHAVCQMMALWLKTVVDTVHSFISHYNSSMKHEMKTEIHLCTSGWFLVIISTTTQHIATILEL